MQYLPKLICGLIGGSIGTITLTIPVFIITILSNTGYDRKTDNRTSKYSLLLVSIIGFMGGFISVNPLTSKHLL